MITSIICRMFHYLAFFPCIKKLKIFLSVRGFKNQTIKNLDLVIKDNTIYVDMWKYFKINPSLVQRESY